jgi:hypothetical protein
MPGRLSRGSRADAFAQKFARYPEIQQLSDLKPDDFVERAVDLRKQMSELPVARVKYRKALIQYMERNKIRPDVIKTVKGRLTTIRQLEHNHRAVEKAKEKDLAGFRAMRNALDAKQRAKRAEKEKAEREGVPSNEVSFKDQMILHDIPSNANAYAVEEKSRGFDFGNNKIASFRLREYLNERRFPQNVIKNVLSRRSDLLRRLSSGVFVPEVHQMASSSAGTSMSDVSEEPSRKKTRMSKGVEGHNTESSTSTQHLSSSGSSSTTAHHTYAADTFSHQKPLNGKHFDVNEFCNKMYD